ncbi:Chaperone protein ClpB [Pelotomaculum schinkii]|uniref:Chaperone protein ClpB n=1 Tax=Pelotomaculum schinkii TaxID=78350 RepID=A0A4Y7RG67_9FIRM|nr:AAA family ATPase [Pelotomaculum schinkii]TEB07771.1 Chaperone protein ClpB [Pelotomaculum schinkii]
MADYISKWHRELGIFSRIKPLIIIEGNVLDVYQYPLEGSISKGSILRLPEYLHYYFKDIGYQTIVFFDSMQGFYNTCEDGHIDEFARLSNTRDDGKFIRSEFKGKTNSASAIVRSAVSQNQSSTAIIMNLASRYITSPDNLEQAEVDSFTNLLLASLEGKDVRTEGGALKNIVVMIVNKTNDVPVWFYHDNPNVKTITISTPSKEEREQLVKGENFTSFFAPDIYAEDIAYYEEHPDELEKVQDKFVGLTEGFSFTEINGLRRLCKNERTHIRHMSTVIDLYKYGIKENPWDTLDENELKNAHEDFEKRIKGQDYAITKTLDVVKRAVTGMAGLQHSSHTKPKGILFFAGPTGTGKTETAKTLAEKLFGDESCCIRFDMSEYGQSHSDQKLLGAPPGYVGYEAGGQLTNAVRENPFSILLFDEIEKANPLIFDKFLQILEDGRMTDGQGNTVYFSECIIIFTSNLGIFTWNAMGSREPNVTAEMEYSEVQKKVRQAIEDYFKLELGRPEILNRIGENIIVFDFIRPPVAEIILDALVNKIIKNLAAEKRIDLVLSDEARATLLEKSLGNLANGARGIGNIVESLLINPLSRYLFDNSIKGDERIVIRSIDAENIPFNLNCTRGEVE